MYRCKRTARMVERTEFPFPKYGPLYKFNSSYFNLSNLQFWYIYKKILFINKYCCFKGLIGIIFGMALILYRVNVKSRQQRQIQNHIETINAILGSFMNKNINST